MKVKKEIEKTLSFDPDKCESLYEDLVKVFQRHKPTIGEIIIATGNLCFTLGASIGQFPGQGPSIKELKKMYYVEPNRIDLALMLQGLTITTWYEDWEKLQLSRTKDNKEKSE